MVEKLLSPRVMSEDYLEITFAKHKVFRETQDVIFYDISIEGNNATDLVEHTGPAISPPDDLIEQNSSIFIIIRLITIVF